MASSVSGDPRVGTTIAGYRIERLLGCGGMSAVYLAEDLALARKVALKLLSPALSRDDAFRERFRLESRLAASIDHPNVVPIYEAGQADDGTLFIAMRFVDGADLKGVLMKEGALGRERTLALISQVAKGLDAAHARGLVHRDVKPSNVLIAQEDRDSEHVYLADFGLTRTANSPTEAQESITLSGSIYYVSPEQIRGTGSDSASDVYALGCLAYECLTGDVPFRRPGEFEVLWAHMDEDPPQASTANSELPHALDAVIAKSMAKEPADRYPSGTELVDAIRNATAEPRRRPVTRRRALLLSTAAVAVAAVVALVLILTTGGPGGPRITTVAGVGLPGFSGDSGLATNAQIFPASLAFDPEGNLYISDQPGRVRKVDGNGFITTVAGTGKVGNSGDGGPATEAEIGFVPSLAFDPDGNLYLAQYDQTALRRIGPDGVIATFVPEPCRGPEWIAADPVGNLYLVCEDNTVRKVDRAGTVTTVAGSGLPGFTGDGEPAIEAELSLPDAIATAPDGSLYITDTGNQRIRRIDPNGVITTVAGTGETGYSGDGGPAAEAEIDLFPGFAALAVDADGNVYFTDNGNERVRRIDPNGVIATVAGTGETGYSGDGGPAAEALLDDPIGLAIDREGNLYIADSQNYRVRKITF